MGLGPPSCDKCNVWLELHPPKSNKQRWRCPVCHDADINSGYRHLEKNGGRPVLPDEAIPLLKFVAGKEN